MAAYTGPLQIVAADELNERLTAVVRERLYDGEPLKILDAGCGRMWTWDLGDMAFRLTGVDEDADALRLRVEVEKDLDDAIAGDLRTVELPEGAFDLVHSSYVLEHIDGAQKVLERMYDALRPGGLMVLKTPDRDSVYSWIARTTPHWVHVQYKRRIRGKKKAGTPGHGPYPVVYDDILSLPVLLDWAENRGMELVLLVGENSHLDFFGPVAPVVDTGLKGVAALSRGHLTARHTNLGLVLRKP